MKALRVLFLIGIVVFIWRVWPSRSTEAPAPIPVAEAPPPTPAAPPIDPQEWAATARGHLEELDRIKDDLTFHQMGFSPASPHAPWLRAVEELGDHPGLTFRQKVATQELASLGRRYVASRGKPTEVTQSHRKTILDVIDHPAD